MFCRQRVGLDARTFAESLCSYGLFLAAGDATIIGSSVALPVWVPDVLCRHKASTPAAIDATHTKLAKTGASRLFPDMVIIWRPLPMDIPILCAFKCVSTYWVLFPTASSHWHNNAIAPHMSSKEKTPASLIRRTDSC